LGDIIRHKCFISYHHDDKDEVISFVNDFDKPRRLFMHREAGIMERELVTCQDDEVIIRGMRGKYLLDTRVTIVLLGKNTWARKHVDWEIAATLREVVVYGCSGLLAINLPSVANRVSLPPRLQDNLAGERWNEGYARWHPYPENKIHLADWIEDAWEARTHRAQLINNTRPLRKRDAPIKDE